MMFSLRNMLFFSLTTLFTMLATGLQAADFVKIGTGGVSGVYFPAGGAICRIVNRERAANNIRCTIKSSGGSVDNINGIQSGEFQLGIAQSDLQFHAYQGSGRFEKDGPYSELRSVFSIHPEPFTVIARADAGIHSFEDLKGKRVNIGNPGSGQRATMEVVMQAIGWTTRDFAIAPELNSADQSAALCEGKIDAMVFVAGHPSTSIHEATTSCASVLVNVDGPEIDNLVSENSFYRYALIPGGMYSGTENDVKTFGVGATVVSASRVSEETIYKFVKSVFENLDEFRNLHPSLANLKAGEMVGDGLSAPLHDGAIRYYREAGLIK